MVSSLILYLLMAALGIVVGARVLKQDKEYRLISNIQTAAIVVLIFTMGARIGADRQLINSIGDMGIAAAVITVFSTAGSVFFVFLGRKLMRMDRKGLKSDD